MCPKTRLGLKKLQKRFAFIEKKNHLYSEISDYSVVFDTQNWLIVILDLTNLHHLSSQH